MAFLEKFNDQERTLLVGIPYRAGLWVAKADHVGGMDSDMKEKFSLESAIRNKSKGMFESAFVHEVMIELNARKAEWVSWAGGLDTLTADCEKAVAVMDGRVDRRDIDAYRHNVMHIAVTVAQSFREFDIGQPFWVRVWSVVRIGLDKMIGLARGEAYESETLLNISYAEDLLLAQLAKALGLAAQGDSLENEIGKTI